MIQPQSRNLFDLILDMVIDSDTKWYKPQEKFILENRLAWRMHVPKNLYIYMIKIVFKSCKTIRIVT